jgi:hypothetical protein
MKRVIVDYSKLTNEILNLLVEKFPEGYDDSNIIRFRNAQNELIEAVEVRTEDTIFLVKISTNLADRIENYDEDDEIAAEIEPLEEGINLEDDDEVEDDDEDEVDEYSENIDKADGDEDDDDDTDDDEEQNDLPEDEDEDYE